MTARFADLLWRLRWILSSAIVVGAVALAPRANITQIDNDITAWFSRDDPVYREYERFREEFGGTRTLIIALEVTREAPDAAKGMFTADRLRFLDTVTGDIERVRTVQRVNSLGTATLVDRRCRTQAPTTTAASRSEPLIPDQVARPKTIRRRALNDDLIRGDLVSEDGRVAAIVVSFDEDRIDEVRGAVIERDPGRSSRSELPPGVRAHYNGSLEISETYNRVTLENQRKFTPPIFVLTFGSIYLMFRSWRRTRARDVRRHSSASSGRSASTRCMGFTYNVLSSMIVPLVVVLAIADDVHIMQHFDDERRHGSAEQAFKRSVTHLLAPLLGASGTTALGMLSLATSNVVAVRSSGSARPSASWSTS